MHQNIIISTDEGPRLYESKALRFGLGEQCTVHAC